MIQPGDKAPNFTLFDTEKKEHDLENYQGKKVLVLFFPLAFSSVCTDELCKVRDDLSIYNTYDTEVIAISVDSLYTLRKFKSEQGYEFNLLSDWNKDISRAYGALHEEFAYGMRGVSKRSAFVIDSKGIVRYAEVLDNPGMPPNFIKIKETLSDIS